MKPRMYVQAHMDPKNGEDQLDVQVLLDFLRLMYSSKATEAKEIRGHLQMLDDDIQQVRQSLTLNPRLVQKVWNYVLALAMQKLFY